MQFKFGMMLRLLFLLLVACAVLLKADVCKDLEKKFFETCKKEASIRDALVAKAKECYPKLMPADADPEIKNYFLSKCKDIDFCDLEQRKKCGPEAMETMNDKQKDAAVKFYDKHHKEFPEICKKGYECMGIKM